VTWFETVKLRPGPAIDEVDER